MKPQLNRRDFLKLAGLLPAAYYLPRANFLPRGAAQAEQQNIIVLVFDAWSASNISLYGYPRQTTPNLEKLAEKAIVYHNHYAAANWTFPGVTGLLTGTYNWTHRGYSHVKLFLDRFKNNNLFSLFNTHNIVAYTHNQIADLILQQMGDFIDHYMPRQDLYVDPNYFPSKIFKTDYDIASVAWVRNTIKVDDGYANSLFLSRIMDFLNQQREKNYLKNYPLGIPVTSENNAFKLETAIDWIIKTILNTPDPMLGYFHVLPPHDPYRPRYDTFGVFENDSYTPPRKTEHPLTSGLSYEELITLRREYDEFILFIDSEINRLYQSLAETNILDNSWVIITSDHGEMFERGISGHLKPTFHNPLVHIPLLILPPGHQERIDVYAPTSALDLLPTLLHISGKPTPDWMEGELLPPYNTDPNLSRSIFSMDTAQSQHEGRFTDATLMLLKESYKLTYFFGTKRYYKALNGTELFELYDLEQDPEEMDNLFEKQPYIAQQMLQVLFNEMEKHGVR